ncbi:MAG: hypothetical protein L6R40_002050 [Gallowayella cf. fulva]|nr:MAG: hypothetical protein L6R40_002050 [Xanthomendoza cf. fulva]
MAHQEEQERQNPPPDLESDFDSTSSSLMSLDDEDDNLENQPQMSDIVSNEEAVSPLTRPTADGQLPNDSGPVTVVPPSSLQRAPLAMMDTTNIAEYILSAEDIEKARENARRLQAARELEKTTYEDTVQASANALATRISENNGLTQELEDIRKVNSGFTLEIATLRESLGTKQEEKERLTACEAALTEEKQRNEELQQEIDKTRRESKIEIEEMMKKITLNAVSNMDKNSPLPIADNNDLAQAHERVRELEEETRHFKDEIIALQAERDEQETEIGSLDATKVKLEAENTKLHRRYTATKARIEQLLNERKHTPAMTDGGADLTNAKASGDATSFFTAPSPISTAVKPPSAAPTALLSHPTTPTTAPTFSKQTLLPLLTTLRQSHIRLAGHIRNAAEEHTPLHASLKKCHQTLEEGEISMREVKRVVKEVVEGSEKVGKGLKGARDGIEVVKGGIMNVWDEVSGPQG